MARLEYTYFDNAYISLKTATIDVTVYLISMEIFILNLKLPYT